MTTVPGSQPPTASGCSSGSCGSDGARDRATGGSGLGLSIVREVAFAHQAALALGRSPQGGLRAEVRFPAK
jgi:signal transduction histidine kinase